MSRLVDSPRVVILLVAVVSALVPASASAQIFLASTPHPEFAIGPLFVVGSVGPGLPRYFTGRIAWRPIILSAVLLLLSNLAGVFMFGQQFAGALRGRLHIGRRRVVGTGRQTGVMLSPETLAAIRPGDSTYADVLRLCGPPEEETELLRSPPRRRLVHRGRRTIPQGRLKLGWFATVNGWNAEDHEVVIELEGDRVLDVDTRVRRFRLS